MGLAALVSDSDRFRRRDLGAAKQYVAESGIEIRSTKSEIRRKFKIAKRQKAVQKWLV
jgi:hypothetical protein